MFKVDSENMTIYLTRGDSASIVFSAKDENGQIFHPTANDRLSFSVAKKFGDAPLIEIVTIMQQDEEAFWTINLNADHTKNLNFGKYCFDVQLEIRDTNSGDLISVNTIIGKTDDISPSFVLWEEISPEGE